MANSSDSSTDDTLSRTFVPLEFMTLGRSQHALLSRISRTRACALHMRATYSSSATVSPVELHYDKVVPPDGNETSKPLVILHGLLYVLISLKCRTRESSAFLAGRRGTLDGSPELLRRISDDLCMFWCVVSSSSDVVQRTYGTHQDLRNHGTSPHAEPHTYSAMALDVIHFFETHKLSNVSLLGHSM